MSANLTKTELKTLSKILEEGEEVIAVGRQHRLTKLIAPAMTLATDKRLIIMKRDVLGIRSDMHFIPYEHIVSFRLVHGFVFSSIKLRLLGASKPNEHAVTSQEEDETEINGLTRGAARILAGKLSANIHERLNRKESGETIVHHTTPVVNIFVMGNGYGAAPRFYLPNTLEAGHNAVMNDYTVPFATEYAYEEAAREQSTSVEEETDGEVAYAIEKPENEESHKGEAKSANSNVALIEVKRTEKKEEQNEKKEEKPEHAQRNQQTEAQPQTQTHAVRPEDLQIFKKRLHRNPIGELTFLHRLFFSKQQGKDDFLEGIEGKYFGDY